MLAESPAAKAGLKVGDMIVEVDGVAVTKAGDLQRLMVGVAFGVSLAIKVLRSKNLVDLKVTLVELR